MKLRFLSIDPTVKVTDASGTFELAIVVTKNPPDIHTIVTEHRLGNPLPEGASAVLALTSDRYVLGQFSFGVFKSNQVAKDMMTGEGIEVSAHPGMPELGLRCLAAGVAVRMD